MLLAPSALSALTRRPWDADRVEHVATMADERGLGELVALCDEMLAGTRPEEELDAWIEHYDLGDLCGPDVRLRRRPALNVTLAREAA